MEDEVFEGIEEEVAPTQKLSALVLLSDLMTNVGSLLEQIAVFPNDISLRLQGHIKWRNGQSLDAEEAARTIEQIEGFANANSDRNA